MSLANNAVSPNQAIATTITVTSDNPQFYLNTNNYLGTPTTATFFDPNLNYQPQTHLNLAYQPQQPYQQQTHHPRPTP